MLRSLHSARSQLIRGYGGMPYKVNGAQYAFYDLQRMEEPRTRWEPHRCVFDPLKDGSPPEETMQQRARRVFGSIASREESRKEALSKAITVAGITIPGKPEEPTNCCMSGCIDCVWELYKDEFQHWHEQVLLARAKLLEPKNRHIPWPAELGPEPSQRPSRKGQETIRDDFKVEDGLDEGLRVFIATEKRLKSRREARKTTKTAV